MTRVFPRVAAREPPVAVRAEGCVIWDAEGRRYLDASGGAVVVGIGHGRRDVVETMSAQSSAVAYVHATQFTTAALEAYAAELADVLPLRGARVYPVSGGSEAVETALKMARACQLGRGEERRHKVVARWGSYHGNTLGALDASGREPLRRPYEPWLGRALHVPAVYEYRCPNPAHPSGCGLWHADLLDETIRREGPETVACFIAEPIGGATVGASVPPDDYWPAVVEVCRSHGVLVVADEVMTGFGRTGAWFACDHWGVRPDIVAAGKGASSGYWPLGFAACSEEVYETIAATGFVHGFTHSHSAVGAAVGRAVLRRLREEDLVSASREKGDALLRRIRSALEGHRGVGDVRGRGLLVGIELVADPDTGAPFGREERVTEQVVEAARASGLLLYSSTGCADGRNGDLLMLGPPLVISTEELDEAVAKTAGAIERVLG